jgi:peroxiredoxin
MLALFLCGTAAYSQDPAQILAESVKKNNEIHSGRYEMRVVKQWAGSSQAGIYHYRASYNKLKNNPINPVAFHSQGYEGNHLMEERIFTGNDLVLLSDSNNTATVMNKKSWKDLMIAYCNTMDLYLPLTEKDMPGFNLKNDENRFTYLLVGTEPVQDVETYHIKITDNKPCNYLGQKTRALETNYWISKADYVPLQYSVSRTLENNGNPQQQFQMMTLTNYTLNPEYCSSISMDLVPARFKKENYEPFKNPELLAASNMAPAWNLPSIANEQIDLASLRGQVVLIDFFYKGCYPCNLAIPGLKELHEKYDNKGLEVIAIDPFDSRENGIAEFIKKKGIKYTVLLSGKETADQYNVTGYPSIYLLDKSGKIIFSQIGYDEALDKKLETMIRTELGLSAR